MLLWGFLTTEMLQAAPKHGGNLDRKTCSPGKERKGNPIISPDRRMRFVWAISVSGQPRTSVTANPGSCFIHMLRRTPHSSHTVLVVTRSGEGRLWDSGPAFDFHLNAEDSTTIRSTSSEETQTWPTASNVLGLSAVSEEREMTTQRANFRYTQMTHLIIFYFSITVLTWSLWVNAWEKFQMVGVAGCPPAKGTPGWQPGKTASSQRCYQEPKSLMFNNYVAFLQWKVFQTTV